MQSGQAGVAYLVGEGGERGIDVVFLPGKPGIGLVFTGGDLLVGEVAQVDRVAIERFRDRHRVVNHREDLSFEPVDGGVDLGAEPHEGRLRDVGGALDVVDHNRDDLAEELAAVDGDVYRPFRDG